MKGTRQTEILRIIEVEQVETQEQLLFQLKKRGVESTQATISRDIKQLHLVKEPAGGGTYRYVVSDRKNALNFAERLRTIFREGVMSIDMAQNLVVINTMPGLASAACAALDGMDIPDMVGSLAGDDTAFIAMRDTASATAFCAEISKLLG
ncbi:MAG: arginine repressor [Pseudoflavonifractor sp.]